jgi:hypothetical protein
MRLSGVRAAAVLAGLVGCLLTAACTPAPLGAAGVILDDKGRPTVLIRSCPGIAVNQVWVYERASDLRWGTADTGRHATPEVRLLQAPEGWNEPEVPAANQLTELTSAATYQVQVSTDHPEKGGIDLVEFRLGDLIAGRVWATRPHGQSQVMSRGEFDRQAADNCS